MNISDLILDLRSAVISSRTTEKTKARKDEMMRLRFSENWTLNEIAQKYNLTSERVRQIVGNSGGGYSVRKARKDIIAHPDLDNSSLAEKLNCSVGKITHYRAGQRHAISGGAYKKGADAEIRVSKKLVELKIDHRLMPHGHPFDIKLLNGKTIDVKSSSTKMFPKSQFGGFYNFRIEKTRRGHYADFFILCLPIPDVYFIVPFDDAPSEYIHLFYPATRKTKYIEFLNQFDLLI